MTIQLLLSSLMLHIVLCSGTLSSAHAEPALFADTGNHYDFIAGSFDWNEAKSDAETKTFLGETGHLATITSEEEDNFIRGQFGGEVTQFVGPWIGGIWDGAGQGPTDGWSWVTGEAFAYTGWNPDEPSHQILGGGLEDALHFSGGGWNDIFNTRTDSIGYIIEYETAVQTAPSSVVNTTGDESDADLSDDVCDIGAAVPEGKPPLCTLRAAIEQANANEGADVITFNIPGTAPHTIQPASKLPAITETLTIDGTTQSSGTSEGDLAAEAVVTRFQPEEDDDHTPSLDDFRLASVGTAEGKADDPKIILDGAIRSTFDGELLSRVSNGFVVQGANSQIRGLRIINFRKNGIKLTKKGAGSRITGNIIGLGPDGQRQPNGLGIAIVNSPNNAIGGIADIPGKDPGNVISGNGIFVFGGEQVASAGVVIWGTNATGNTISGNLIGTNVEGTATADGSGDGIRIDEASGNVIGGKAAGAGNVISGNSIGVVIKKKEATGNTILGNLIGTNRAGDTRVPNAFFGVSINDAPGNTVGGTDDGAGNVISGNGEGFAFVGGVQISGGDATANTVVGNLIGFDAFGEKDLGNSACGVCIEDAADNTIEDNHIGGNGGAGLRISGKSSRNNVIRNNTIGETSDGAPVPNGSFGITLQSGAKRNTIGGIDPSDGNTITTGNKPGVVVKGGKNNAILSNNITIFDQLMLFDELGVTDIGIDLGVDDSTGEGDGITPNDVGDADKGPNKLQNFPVLTSAQEIMTTAAVNVSIEGSLNSQPGKTYTIQFFQCNDIASKFLFLESTSVATDEQGNGDFAATLNLLIDEGDFVTATATDPKGNTSELSLPCIEVGTK